MSELLKIASKNEDGYAVPFSTDRSGNVIARIDETVLPVNDSNTPQKLIEARRALKKKYIAEELVFIGNDEHILDGWSKNERSGTSMTMDSTILDDGTYSVKLTNSTAASYIPVKAFTPHIDMSGYESFSIWVHTDTLSEIARFTVTVEAPDSTNKYTFRETISRTMLKEIQLMYGHGELVFRKSDFIKNGNADWSNVGRVYVTLTNKTSGTPASINLANFKAINPVPSRAKIMFRIDDGLRSVYDVAMPIFREYKIPATIFVPPQFVLKGAHGKSNAYGLDLDAMSFEEIDYLHSLGWSICSHSFGHTPYYDPSVPSSAETTAKYRRSYAQAFTDFIGTQKWFTKNGFKDMTFGHGFPNNWYDEESQRASLDVWLLDFSKRVVNSYVECLPWGKNINHISAESFIATENDTYPVIDNLIAEKGLMIPCFHRFDGDGIDGSVSQETLENLLKYICEKDGVDCITAADLANATAVALN